jgi:GTPase SAR1 family protein
MAREEVVPRGVRCQVVVIGDRGTGKSSLIIAVATDSFPDKAPPVLPPTRLPHDFYPDRVPLTIVDTSSRLAGCTLLLLPAARMLFLGGTSLGRGFDRSGEKIKTEILSFPRGLTIYARVSN